MAKHAAESPRARRFDALYRASIDPWRFRTSAYEREKYAATVAALPRSRYERAIEVGCSIGELARLLRERADEVIALDVSNVAIAEARRLHGAVPGLIFETGEVPRDWPAGRFDLIVLSEVLYFLAARELDALAARVASALAVGGHCVTVCWLGETDRTTDLGGDEAGERFTRSLIRAGEGAITRDHSASRREPRYRLDVLVRSS